MFEAASLIRLMKLCRLLAAGEGARMQQIRAKLRTSRRTTFRDLKHLQSMGVPITLSKHLYQTRLPLRDCRRRIGDHQIRKLNKVLDSCL